MARKGGYSKSEPVEWFKVPIQTYGEAIVSATSMGQDVQTWLIDAVNHHLYRCDLLQAQQRYQADDVAATAANRPTPDKNDPRYTVTRPKPTITLRAGQGAGTSGPRLRPRP